MKGYPLGSSNTVSKLAELNITGNVTPLEWFNHIKRPNGKPNLNAIVLLADIVYWYRPVEVRDETTGKLTGYRQKFKADLLQHSYSEFAKQYGLTKDQVRALRDRYSIYIVDSGRINVAGLTEANLPGLCQSIAEVL